MNTTFSPTISVIVPVFKAEKYIEECAYSILDQISVHDELILVDDGSPDNSGYLCEKIKKIDNRVKVIHQINGGVTQARKKGVELAKGEWIMFVDADDTLAKNAINNLYSVTKKYVTEMVIGFSYECQEKDKIKQLNLDDYRNFCIIGRPIQVAPWGKLIKRSLFNKDTFEIPRKIIRGEDMLMNIRLSFSMSNDPVILYKKVYNYRNNLESVTHKFKESFDYEVEFHSLMKYSIPPFEYHKYEKAFILKRIECLKSIYEMNPFASTWLKSEFYTQLISDISRTEYKMSIIDNIILKGNTKYNRLLVYIIVKLDKLIHRLYHFLCRLNHKKTF